MQSNDSNFNSQYWWPKAIDDLEKIVARRITTFSSNNYRYALKKNICYNLQYLEFINWCFSNVYLAAVLRIQNYKMFILVATSIIEGILFHELIENNLQKKSSWSLLKKIISNTSRLFDTKLIKLETHIYEETSRDKNEEMSFDQMLSKVESKNLLGINHAIYAKIKILRKLRNKIHIHLATSKLDTDFNSFNERKFKLAKATLLDIFKIYFSLTDEESDEYFYYLQT